MIEIFRKKLKIGDIVFCRDKKDLIVLEVTSDEFNYSFSGTVLATQGDYGTVYEIGEKGNNWVSSSFKKL